jgi:UDP-glucose 4-epimerase
MARILITGGAGFIGGFLAAKLVNENHQVEIADNFSRAVQDDFFVHLSRSLTKIHNLDLLKEASWNELGDDFDYIVHLAAIIGVKHVLEKPYSVLRDNVLLTDLAIQFAKRQRSLKKFLFASTSEVMSGSLLYLDLPLPTPESFPLALTDLSSPRTSYMLSKIYGEAMCNHSGVPFVIIRPHNIYGPRMGSIHVVPELLYKAYKLDESSTLEVASVEHSRAMCYIDDAIEMIQRLLLFENTEGQTYNVGNQSTEIKIGDLANVIVQVVGKNLNIKAVQETAGSPNRRCPEMSKTLGATGYSPLVSIEEGVSRTYKWYKENVFLNSSKTAI